ncbi:hypothetical protein LINPERPRIM_LOCUS24138 [Linum perenne]
MILGSSRLYAKLVYTNVRAPSN